MFSGPLKTFMIIGFVLVIFIAVGIIYAYYSDSDALGNIKETVFKGNGGIVVPHQPGAPGGGGSGPVIPGFKVMVKDKKTIVVRWSNLPPYTLELVIFRTEAGKDDWTKWKSVPVSELDIVAGEIAISLGSGDGNAGDYEYYVEAISPFSDTSWTSAATTPEPYTPPPTSTPPVSTPGETTPPPAESAPVTPPPSTPPTDTTPPPSSGGNGSEESFEPAYYYSPSGDPYYGTPDPAGTFWVRHVNRNIELGWQNLPSGTNKIKIYRSANPGGPWENIVIQDDPDIVGPTMIRLVDLTITDPFYYEMDALSGSTVLESYGPEFLDALE